MSDIVTRLNKALEGRYHIESELGEGGMATVYLADDIKHERKVAVKVLRPELAAVVGAERFLAEIKTTANLQHPHILPLFDSGEADNFLFYVMPYVVGETLRERIDQEKQLGVDEALALTRKVADALDYAHGQGVVHRDIKPGNILMSERGEPLVADFGIALAVAQAGGGRITETGLSLGTPHYMSPEQATGDRDVDPRSDVYALGCVLYEMLAGEPPFSASTAQAILAKILTMDAPSITMMRRTVSPNVSSALAKALEKLPADRFTSAADFAEALDDRSFTYEARARTATVAAQPAQPAAPARPWMRDARSAAAVAVAAVMTAVAAWGWLGRPPAPEPGVPTRAEITGLNLGAPGGSRLAISRDGRSIVAGHRGDDGPALYLRTSASTEWRRLPNTENSTNPTFSPDGQWVAFSANGSIWKVPVTGGTALPVAAGGRNSRWAEGDVIVYDDGEGIYQVSGAGGESELLFRSDTLQATRPYLLPGGRGVVFQTESGGDPLSARILLLETETGEIREVVASGNQPMYVPTGHLIYGHGDGAIMGVRFDLETLEAQGSPVPLVTELSIRAGGASQFAVSETGTLIYAAGEAGGIGDNRVVWVDRSGGEEPIPVEPRGYLYPRLSPDGTRLALDDRRDGAIRIWDFAGGTLQRMVLGDAQYAYPVWTPDGRSLAYAGDDELFVKATNTGVPESLGSPARGDGRGAGRDPSPYFFSPDGASLVLRDQANPDTDDDLMMISVADGSVEWRLNGDYVERNAELSPNGRWMAYASDESGERQIYVRPFPDVESDQILISNAGGDWPLWSRDGRELFYLQPVEGQQLVSVAVDTGGADGPFAFGAREVLMDWPYRSNAEGRGYDASLDGQRFLAVKPEGETGAAASSEVYLVTNWFEELLERMGS